MTFDELYEAAKSVLNPRRLSEYAEAGGVGAALLSESGRLYTGVCIDTGSSLGFCAEHAAAAAMITAGESRVLKMIAVGWDGRIMPPCGRCREFISQLDDGNRDTEVKVDALTVVTLGELLPYDWRNSWRDRCRGGSRTAPTRAHTNIPNDNTVPMVRHNHPLVRIDVWIPFSQPTAPMRRDGAPVIQLHCAIDDRSQQTFPRAHTCRDKANGVRIILPSPDCVPILPRGPGIILVAKGSVSVLIV